LRIELRFVTIDKAPELRWVKMARVPDKNANPTSDRKSSTRRYARYRTELPLIVKVLGQEGYVRVHGRCFEVAENGLGAVITSEFRPGEMVSLEFSFPDVSEVQVIRAVVRHRMGFLHGFEFINPLPEQREYIRAYCRTLQPA